MIVYYFGRISLISLVTNFFILPAQPPIMTGGMATLVAGLAWEPLAARPGADSLVVPDLHHRGGAADGSRTASSVETGELGRVAALVYMAVVVGALSARSYAPATAG